MTFFFFVVGLEVRREFDVGELRERNSLALPVLAALGGMAVPIAIYLAFNGGGDAAGGWGVAMSTDTAFALGMLALVGPRFPDRLRGFMLTIIVVDDVVALLVIGVAYSDEVVLGSLLIAAGVFAVILLALRAAHQAGPRLLPARRGRLGGAVRIRRRAGGPRPRCRVDHLGLSGGTRRARAGDPALPRLPRAADPRARPLGQSGVAGRGLAQRPDAGPLPPVDQLRGRAAVRLANVGIALDGGFLGKAYTSPLTLGIVAAYVLGKPVGVTGMAWLASKLSRGRINPPVGWVATAGGGAVAGIGFTVSLLIASLAFDGLELREAKLGVLTAALGASLLTWLVFRATAWLPRRTRIRALLGTSETLVDLAVPVDPGRDHIRGPHEAPVTVVEYGDFECPYCGRAEPVIRELLADFGDLRYVWRHLPLSDVHPRAELAAEAAEAAAAQGAFWEMHDLLLAHQGDLSPRALRGYAEQLGLDLERFREETQSHAHAPASPTTSTQPTAAASPAPRPSSSTTAATRAPTTSRPSRRRSRPPGAHDDRRFLGRLHVAARRVSGRKAPFLVHAFEQRPELRHVGVIACDLRLDYRHLERIECVPGEQVVGVLAVELVVVDQVPDQREEIQVVVELHHEGPLLTGEGQLVLASFPFVSMGDRPMQLGLLSVVELSPNGLGGWLGGELGVEVGQPAPPALPRLGEEAVAGADDGEERGRREQQGCDTGDEVAPLSEPARANDHRITLLPYMGTMASSDQSM